MKTHIEIFEYDLPESWACGLINGDESGMSPLDLSDMHAWLVDHEGQWPAECSDESFITSYHDAQKYIGKAVCLTYRFHKF